MFKLHAIFNDGSVGMEFMTDDPSEAEDMREQWLAFDCVAGIFQGEADPYLQATDFEGFLHELRLLSKELRGTATFKTVENQLGFSLTGDGLGHITLHGYLLDRSGFGNRFQFNLSYDQTFLGESIAAIKRLLDATIYAKSGTSQTR